MTRKGSPLSLCLGDVFGGRAIELAGRVVHPDYQRQGIASTLLSRLIHDEKPEILTTYTRNPSILKMIDTVSETMYPVVHDDDLRAAALEMDHASLCDVVYHLERYDESGLFHGEDPANRPFAENTLSLKQQFTELSSVRNALIVAARVRRSS